MFVRVKKLESCYFFCLGPDVRVNEEMSISSFHLIERTVWTTIQACTMNVGKYEVTEPPREQTGVRGNEICDQKQISVPVSSEYEVFEPANETDGSICSYLELFNANYGPCQLEEECGQFHKHHSSLLSDINMNEVKSENDDLNPYYFCHYRNPEREIDNNTSDASNENPHIECHCNANTNTYVNEQQESNFPYQDLQVIDKTSEEYQKLDKSRFDAQRKFRHVDNSNNKGHETSHAKMGREPKVVHTNASINFEHFQQKSMQTVITELTSSFRLQGQMQLRAVKSSWEENI